MPDAPITPRSIAAAERLLGIRYTPAERQQMLAGLAEQRAQTLRRREVLLANDQPLALRFDPRLPGFTPPHAADLLRLTPVTAALPDNDTDIAFAPVTHLSHWIRQGWLTSERLTGIHLDRIARLAGPLCCFAEVTADRAVAEAQAADRLLSAGTWLGPLHGIPYGLKDLFDAKGTVTGWGAEPFRERRPDRDAAVVERLSAAGAVLIGKTAVGALAYGDIWYGGTSRNPWNLKEGSSGSSAGSASAVAAGLCGFAIGTETLGSITSPSQRCGTTGLRPTFGRISRAGGMALCPTLDKVGPICRGVEDTALVLAALNGADPADPSSIGLPFAHDAAAPITGLTVGYLPETFADAATDTDRKALDVLRSLGVRVIPVSLRDLPYDALVNSLLAESAAMFEDLTLSGADDSLTWQEDDAWPNTFRRARFLSAVDHVQLDRLRYQVMLALDDLFRQCDVLVGPHDVGPMLIASNYTGHPSLILRAGFERRALQPAGPGVAATSPETDLLPHGIVLWTRLFDEGPMLALGTALEAALGVATLRPAFAA